MKLEGNCDFSSINNVWTTLLSLIDKPVRLLKRQPILYTGLFVVVMFIYLKFFLGFTGQPELPTAG